MEETLHNRVIGQEEAVVAISRAIRRARVGLKNPNRPIASFIFSGPTGVGKSELAKTLATYYFGSEDAMVRLDMSEYMERHTVSKLIGSPPGYVGYFGPRRESASGFSCLQWERLECSGEGRMPLQVVRLCQGARELSVANSQLYTQTTGTSFLTRTGQCTSQRDPEAITLSPRLSDRLHVASHHL
uniref:Atp-dependent clp protease atp-binding subunit clpa protein chloroplastic-like n=1 Tax=Tetraselmis sp. GSL018 TaxID=582737 RepID=A0A061R8R3_9CHLO